MIMQRSLTVMCIAALLGGIAVTILYAIGVSRPQTAAIAFLLGGVILTTGLPVVVGRAGAWGVPHDLG